MNAERLLAHYEKIADGPDAIPRLRRFVLDLAVRGKLVPQDSTDEPASELLKRIAAERARLIKAGKIRRPKEVAAVARGLPFVIPLRWTSAPLDHLSPHSLVDGDWIETKDQSVSGTVRLIQLADIGVGEFLDKSARFITEETEVRLNCTRLVPSDVLIARLPNPIGRACLFPDIGQPAITAVDVAILRPDRNVDPAFVVLSLNAPPTRTQIEAYGKGTTRFRVSTGHLKTVVLPVPPLAEQHRIVVKVDELMALCDRLEASLVETDEIRRRLLEALLAEALTPDEERGIEAAK
jgi:type I restriction enzyme, S subunit